MSTDTATTDVAEAENTTTNGSVATSTEAQRPEPGEVILNITEDALETVRGARADEPDAEELALRVEIVGTKGIEYTYELSFEEMSAVDDEHHQYQVGDITVVMPYSSVDRLRGAELDLPRSPGQGGLVIRNPNRADPLAGLNLELTGDLANQVGQLIEHSINPALDSHGGYASLLGVDDSNAVYITMGGGCQGCAASAATLTQGIKRSVMQAIPEVTDVIDATDHSSGSNPYYS